jgi:hypothetical protein
MRAKNFVLRFLAKAVICILVTAFVFYMNGTAFSIKQSTYSLVHQPIWIYFKHYGWSLFVSLIMCYAIFATEFIYNYWVRLSNGEIRINQTGYNQH